MNKPLFLFVGPSGCGKTTVVQNLENQYGYKTVQSFTTRPKRHDDEIGHIFITDDEFDKLKNIVAYTNYNGFRYCTTKERLDLVTTYVVDIPGVETLLKNYNTKRSIIVFYLESTVRVRIERMVDRNDSDAAIIGRLFNDEEFDWYNKLDKIVWHYQHIEHKNVELYTIDANQNERKVIEQVLCYMRTYLED